ncbi:MAG: BadF/BadG/BcrA/BcrD ATPase family protein [Rhodothermales bacterium]
MAYRFKLVMPPLFIGIDAGGTKTHLYASSREGHHVFEGRGGPANLRVQGVAGCFDTITSLTDEAQDTLDLPLGGVCVGAAGAGDPSLRYQLEDRLRRWTSVPLIVTTDADIALHAALGTESGYLVIAGTGSIVYGRDASGAIHRAGGWGWTLGDDGSGTALGQAVLRAAAAAFDGGPPTDLVDLLAQRYSVQQLSDVLTLAFQTPSLSTFAPLVFEAVDADDAVALAILQHATQNLSVHLLRLATQHPSIPRRAFLTGGVTCQAPFSEALRQALNTANATAWQLAPSPMEPHRGAWAMIAPDTQPSAA